MFSSHPYQESFFSYFSPKNYDKKTQGSRKSGLSYWKLSVIDHYIIVLGNHEYHRNNYTRMNFVMRSVGSSDKFPYKF